MRLAILVLSCLLLAARIEAMPGEWTVRKAQLEQELFAIWPEGTPENPATQPIVDVSTMIGAGLPSEDEGIAEWVLAIQTLGHCNKGDVESRRHIARAAMLLKSDIPIYIYGFDTSPLFDEQHRREALPLLLLARDLDAPWTAERLQTYTKDEIEAGRAEVHVLVQP